MICKEGEMLMCISDWGWTPGCITKGNLYEIHSVDIENNYMTIIANGGYKFKTSIVSYNAVSSFRTCFKPLSEIREEKLNKLL